MWISYLILCNSDVSEIRVREKRTVSSSSSSSTSTELCDDPVSECCSERSVDEDGCNGHDEVGNENDGLQVIVECRLPEVKASGGDDNDDDDDGDVSLAEMLRANSEVLKRMCRGRAADPETDLEERLPDLINDIGVLGELLTADTAAAVTSAASDEDFREIFAKDSMAAAESSANDFRDLFPDESLRSTVETSAAAVDDDFRDAFADEASSGPVRVAPVLPPQLPKGSQDNFENSATAVPKPFAPFPSKVRQPKRLGIELGLYPDGSN